MYQIIRLVARRLIKASIVSARSALKGVSFAKIGAKFGISGERARVIVLKATRLGRVLINQGLWTADIPATCFQGCPASLLSSHRVNFLGARLTTDQFGVVRNP
jgi:hypothetical protein